MRFLAAVAVCATSISAMAQGTLLIKMHFKGDDYTVSSVKHIEQSFPAFINSGDRAEDLAFRLSNSDNETLGEGSISDPRVMHGVLTEDGNVDDASHTDVLAEEGYFLVRYPYAEGMQFLELLTAADMNKVQSAPTEDDEVVSRGDLHIKKIDLAPFITK